MRSFTRDLIEGEERIERRFLWRPKMLRTVGGWDMRWLEFANIRQQVVRCHSIWMHTHSWLDWRDKEFVGNV